MTVTSVVGQSAAHEMGKDRNNQLRHLISSMTLVQSSLEDHEDRIANLEDTMRINGVQEKRIHDAGQIAAMRALGGKKAPAYKAMSRRVFNRVWSEFKQYFDLTRYSELPAKDYQRGLEFVSDWEPAQDLKMDIREANRVNDDAN